VAVDVDVDMNVLSAVLGIFGYGLWLLDFDVRVEG